jgi:3-hydroxymyristoyl/3-hydroxydecanoyl-(acyl carrier protein) dehydratase
MSERFRAFSFVDRITQRAGGHIEGQYTVPANATRFPASLMAEAVGQLAAWSAMAQLDFAFRPVAGLASETHYHRIVTPGQTLRLEADIARCDPEAVAYSGRALIDGRLALELVDCVGPMLPMNDFDDPEAVRADFHTLSAAGAAGGRFTGVPEPAIELQEHVAGQRLRATLQVPLQQGTPYFDDHFPRRPVFPGTLLLDALAGLAVQLACEALPGSAAAALMPKQVSQVKIRSFTAPGTTLELEVDLLDKEADRARLKLGARNEGKSIATARIEVGRLEPAQS